jgi:hypothetical protein
LAFEVGILRFIERLRAARRKHQARGRSEQPDQSVQHGNPPMRAAERRDIFVDEMGPRLPDGRCGHDTPAMRGGGRAASLRGASDPAAALRRAVTAARAGTTTMFNIYPNCNQTTTVQPMRKRTVTVNDKVQRGYRYVVSAPIGRDFDPEFRPGLTPQRLLRLGVFGGKYMTDTKKGFP